MALRELIFGCLEERRIVVDEQSAAQIHGCEDLSTLQRWARRAMSVTSPPQLFE